MPRSAKGGCGGGSRSAVQRVFTVFYVDAVVYYYISIVCSPVVTTLLHRLMIVWVLPVDKVVMDDAVPF